MQRKRTEKACTKSYPDINDYKRLTIFETDNAGKGRIIAINGRNANRKIDRKKQ